MGARFYFIFPVLRTLFSCSKVSLFYLKTCTPREVRRPHSTYQKVVQGKCPLHFFILMEPFARTLFFSNTSALTNSLLVCRTNSTCKIPEHLVWLNTSRFQSWGPLAALCSLPMKGTLWSTSFSHQISNKKLRIMVFASECEWFCERNSENYPLTQNYYLRKLFWNNYFRKIYEFHA